MELLIDSTNLHEILRKARESRTEICGLLFGELENHRAVVKKISFIRNTLNSQVEFLLDPEEMIREIEIAEEEGLEIVGIFHSHLCKPLPSERDVEGMKNWRVVWLIVDNRGDYGAFILEEKIKEVDVKIRRV